MTETVHNNSPLSSSFELVGTMSLDKNDRTVTNLLFASPGLYSNILTTEKMLQFSAKYCQSALNLLRWQLIADHNE